MRVAAHEVEEAIVERLQLLAEDPTLLDDKLTTETNRKLQQSRPKLERQQTGLQKDLKELKTMADKLVTELVSLEQQAGHSLLRDKLNELGQRQLDLERGMSEVQQELDSLDRKAVDAESVRSALCQVKELFGALKPYEQKELMQLVLQRAEINERENTLDIYALNGASLPEKVGAEGEVVRTRPDWLPRQGANRRYYAPSPRRLIHQCSPEPTAFLDRNRTGVSRCSSEHNNTPLRIFRGWERIVSARISLRWIFYYMLAILVFRAWAHGPFSEAVTF